MKGGINKLVRNIVATSGKSLAEKVFLFQVDIAIEIN